MTLDQHQKQMIADMLLRTETKADIENNAEKILGNAYGNKETAKTFKELAKSKVKMVESRQ